MEKREVVRMVAIKGMSMPKYCNDCDFVADSMGYCERAKEQIPNYDFYSETNERPDFCPLTETEERKGGKWEYTGSYEVEGLLKCTICGHEIDVTEGYYKFCPMCGAEMEGNNGVN